MPVMEMKLVTTYQDQTCVNTFNYISGGTPASVSFSFGLASAAGFVPAGPVFAAGTLAHAIQSILVPDVTFQLVSVRDVHSFTDFYEVPFVPDTVGTVSGTGPAAPFLAYGFRTNRTRLDIRRGQKRFVGVAESGMDDGGLINPAFRAAGLTNLAQKLGLNLAYDDEGNNLTYQPCVVSKMEYTPDPLKPDRKAYKYYPTASEQLEHVMTSIIWTALEYVTTQNSRKRGKGT